MKERVILAGGYRHTLETLLEKEPRYKSIVGFESPEHSKYPITRSSKWFKKTYRIVLERLLMSDRVYVIVPMDENYKWNSLCKLFPGLNPIYIKGDQWPKGESDPYFRIGKGEHSILPRPQLPRLTEIERAFYRPLVSEVSISIWYKWENMTNQDARRLGGTLFDLFYSKEDPDPLIEDQELLIAHLRSFLASMLKLGHKKGSGWRYAWEFAVATRWFEDIVDDFVFRIRVLHKSLQEANRLDADLLISHVNFDVVEMDSGEVRQQILNKDHQLFAAIRRTLRVPSPQYSNSALISDVIEFKDQYRSSLSSFRQALLFSRLHLSSMESRDKAEKLVLQAQRGLVSATKWERLTRWSEYLITIIESLQDAKRLPFKIISQVPKIPAKYLKTKYDWVVQLRDRLP